MKIAAASNLEGAEILLRVAVMSDLHIEVERQHTRGRPPAKTGYRKELEGHGHPAWGPDLIGLNDADLVLLAGDISTADFAPAWVEQVARFLGVPVFLIAGNHEFYNRDHGHAVAELRRSSKERDGIHFLERDKVELEIRGEAVRILGATLWTDFDLFNDPVAAMKAARNEIADFGGTISQEPDGDFLPEHSVEIHKGTVAWLRAELAKPFDGTTIVMTHHAPSQRSVPAEFVQDPLSPCFASNLDDLVKNSGAVLWVHGHTHTSMDYMCSGTRVVSNPRGYVGYELNVAFDAGLIVEVKA